MLQPRTLKILAVLLSLYGLVLLAAYRGPAFLEPVAAWFAFVPYLSLLLFHQAGVPGLLEHKGLCGWGMCAPTALGWAMIVVVWLLAFWLLAWALARWTRRGAA